MRLLFDTHVVLWAFDNPNSLSPGLIDALRRSPRLAVSVASLWEIAIKTSKGKLRAPDDLPERLVASGFELLSVTAAHAWAVRTSPQILRHKDPFDRMLVAQARMERMTLVTRDAEILLSGVDVLEA